MCFSRKRGNIGNFNKCRTQIYQFYVTIHAEKNHDVITCIWRNEIDKNAIIITNVQKPRDTIKHMKKI